MDYVNISSWKVTGVKVLSKYKSVIDIYIPPLTVDRVYVRLNILDRLLGKSLEDKTVAVLRKCEAMCEKKNQEQRDNRELGQKIFAQSQQQKSRPPGVEKK